MEDSSIIFLLANMALAFYNTGTIWAMEVDIFRSWRLMDAASFQAVRKAHWKKLPYWIFTPVGVALSGSVVLTWSHPAGSPGWAIWGSLGCQVCSHVLTALFWGPWQAGLSRDPSGAKSPLLAKILATHWVRTLLINAYAAIEFIWVLQVVGRR
jgi:hypothetical protein